jgi:hypothetical protein
MRKEKVWNGDPQNPPEWSEHEEDLFHEDDYEDDRYDSHDYYEEYDRFFPWN